MLCPVSFWLVSVCECPRVCLFSLHRRRTRFGFIFFFCCCYTLFRESKRSRSSWLALIFSVVELGSVFSFSSPFLHCTSLRFNTLSCFWVKFKQSQLRLESISIRVNPLCVMILIAICVNNLKKGEQKSLLESVLILLTEIFVIFLNLLLFTFFFLFLNWGLNNPLIYLVV